MTVTFKGVFCGSMRLARRKKFTRRAKKTGATITARSID